MRERDVGPGCCLLAVVGALIGAGFVALLAFLVIRLMPVVMPKMMAWMMPKMMAFMEEAGVEPPCAQILKQYHEERQARTG